MGMSSSGNQQIMSEATTPTSSDVLCGTGYATAKHPGNKLFTRTVSEYVEQYGGAESKKEKMKISKAALDELTSSGVRFLKKHPVYKDWYVASEKVGRDKIGHFLRENIPNTISGSENDRRRQRLAGPNYPQSPDRPNTPLSAFLHDRSSPDNARQGNLSSVWGTKLDELQEAALLLAQEGRETTNQVSGNASRRSPFRAPSFSKGKPTPLFVSSAYHGMEALEDSTDPSLKKELNKIKKVHSDQSCRQENPMATLAKSGKQKCVPAKYDHSASQETLHSIGSFPSGVSSEIPRGVDLISGRFSWRPSSKTDDAYHSDVSMEDLFDDSELAQRLDWQVS